MPTADKISLSGLAPTSTIPGVAPVAGPKDAKRGVALAGIDRFFWDHHLYSGLSDGGRIHEADLGGGGREAGRNGA
jgi:hypothetical protein